MIAEARLADGTRALVLPLRPSDREAIREGYEHLSAETREHRFLSGVPHLTEVMLDHLVDEVDGIDHVALALVVVGQGGEGMPVAVGHMIRYPDRPGAADVAVTVVDGWQGRGVATALLAELLRQRPEGVSRIMTTVAADNPASLAMLRRLGPATVTRVGSNLEVVVDLPDTEPPPGPGGT
ncbi:GNAT family N-acetyltransferase [Nocardioides guangzhouensis]|uniref:GNAT family N-acetyltransferase n=1 Tax=Nocardioides guangzhouensis TaxID=2497878 RepID=UPI0014385810|nr:GNAT family N-acetyltransferase [Nocardioides guangzhouensis]